MANHTIDCEFCGKDQRIYSSSCCEESKKKLDSVFSSSCPHPLSVECAKCVRDKLNLEIVFLREALQQTVLIASGEPRGMVDRLETFVKSALQEPLESIDYTERAKALLKMLPTSDTNDVTTHFFALVLRLYDGQQWREQKP